MNVARLLAFSLGAMLWSADRFEVDFCNVRQISNDEMARAKGAASYAFSAIGIDITWASCTPPGTKGTSVTPRFDLQLMDRPQPIVSGYGTRDAFGRAHLTSDATADFAEIYYEPVRQVASAYQLVERGEILGYAMAHELGHLLLGPQHTPHGIMRARWNVQDLQMMMQLRLRFSSAQRSAMHLEIQRRIRTQRGAQ